MPGRQRRHLEAEPAPGEALALPVQGPPVGLGRLLEQLLGPPRRLGARAVCVEKEYHLVRVPAKYPEVRDRQGGPEHGHGLGEAVLVGHQAVDVALDQEGPAGRRHPVAREVQAVERLALLVERGLGRVEVLGLLAGQGAARRSRSPAPGCP